jgi:predicted Zn-dependent peptidase
MSPVDRSRLPAPGPDPAFTLPSAVKQRLDNGLALWTVERRGLPLVSIALLLPAGSALDPPGQSGLAALTADMIDEGSGDRSAIQMQEAFARIGAELDTETGPDSVLLSLSVLERFVPEGLQLLADIAARPRLAGADVERVRTLRMNRLRQLKDIPGVNAEAVLLKAVYGPLAYGHLPIGSTTSLASLTREDVARFHLSRYDAAGATLIGVGATSPDAFARQADAAFRDWAGSPEARTPAAGAGGAAESQDELPRRAPRLLLVDRPGAAQTELRIGHRGVPRRTADFHALVLLNAVLGGHFMSRLNLNLRERKGYTYGVRSSFDFRRMAGPFSVQTSVRTDATADAVGEILGELSAIRGQKPAGDGELALSVATLTKGYPRSFETIGQVARGLAQLALYELPDDTFEVFTPRIRSLNTADVTRVAHAHLDPDSAVIVAVGDATRIREGLEAGDLGPAVVATPDL